MEGDGPGGRVVVLGPDTAEGGTVGSIELACGELRVALGVDGVGLAELAPGTRLRLGGMVVIELAGGPARSSEAGRGGGLAGIWERSGVCLPARVVAGGAVRVGDPVAMEAMALPLEDSLDLHTFQAAEIGSLVETYLAEAQGAGFVDVRIIHGRGRGVQRETVRRLLATLPGVAGFGDAPPEGGGWGATVVRLRLRPGRPP